VSRCLKILKTKIFLRFDEKGHFLFILNFDLKRRTQLDFDRKNFMRQSNGIFSTMALSVMTLCVKTLSIMDLIVTFSIKDTQ
jgi:hypothetical protein